MKTKLYHYSNGKRESVHTDNKGNLVTESGKNVNGKVTSNPNAGNQYFGGKPDYDPNPFKGSGQGEWDDYAHTADDL